MRKSLILAVSLSLFALSGFLFTPAVFAEDYMVKSVIIIPPDWQGKLNKEQLDTYKTGIINGLNAVRLLYANTLSGKTFQFDRNIDVVSSKDPIEKVEEKLMLDRDYRSSFYTTVFPDRAGVVYIAWGIGTKNGVRRGDPVSKDFGFVWLKHQDILGLTADGTEDERKWSLSMLAHELGHAFGLVFAGYADGHPCTEESPQECSANAPRPYPGSFEWASIMGYGTPYLSFPNLFFNNTIYNPEIQKIFKSPFINPSGDPAPSPATGIGGQKQGGPVFFELSPGTIIAGQNFAIKGVNLENFREFEIRRKDLSQPANKDRLQNAKMLDNNGSTIRINVAEDAVPSNSDSSWEIKLLDKGGTSLTIPIELGIKGKNTSGAILAADITATCGPDKKAVQAAPVRLQTRNGSTLAQIDTQVDGTAILNYTIEDPSNRELALKADEIQGIAPTSDSPGAAGASSKDVTVPSPPQSFNASASFHYPECPSVCNPKITFLCGGTSDAAGFPSGHTIKMTPNCSNTNLYGEGLASKEDLGDRGECAAGVVVPNVTAGLPTPVERVSSRGTSGGTVTDSQGAPISQSTDTYTGLTADIAAEGTKLIISNYPDFRPQNEEGDIGSPTIVVDPGSKVTWTLSTLDSADDRQVSIAEITNGKINDSTRTPYLKGDGGIIEAGGVYIKTETVKDFVSKNIITVNGIRHELTADKPSISLRLNGTEGTPQAFDLPYEIYYADSANPRGGRLPLNYQPRRQCECPYSNTCTTPDGQAGTQECQGVYEYTAQGKQCSFDQTGGCTPACRECNAVPPSPEPEASPEPSEKPTPTPTPETNYCEEAGYYSCEPGIATGSTCDLNGQTCTAYSKNQCNFKGQAYCDNSACGEPCESPPATDCGTPTRQYNVCVACDKSQEILKDDCGNWKEGDIKDDSTGQCSGPEWCGTPPTQVCDPNSQGPLCDNGDRCADGSLCAQGHQYCLYDGSGYGACSIEVDNCATQCAAPPPTQACSPGSQGPVCDTNWCADGSVCGQGHQYCLDDGSGYGSCSEEVNNCASQCAAPGGLPSAPSIAVNVGCINNGDNGSGFTISWSGTDITYVDISTDNFNSFYNKWVSGSTSTTADGFNAYQNASGTLTFSPNTTYQVRVYDGSQHSDSTFFTTPDLCAGQACSPGSQGPVCDTNWCADGSVCGQGHQYCLDDGSGYGSCSEEVNNCASQCAAPPPPPTGCEGVPGSPWVPTGDGLGYVCGHGGHDLCTADGMGDACVGVPYVCSDGQWVSMNDYGECTTVCGPDSGLCD